MATASRESRKFCPHRRAWVPYFPDEVYDACLCDTKEWLLLKARPTNYVSAILVHQLTLHASRFGDFHGLRWRHFHFHGILDAIAEVEGTSQTTTTGPAKPFHLKGIWHKHFFDPQFIERNLQNEAEDNLRGLQRIFTQLREQAGLAQHGSTDRLNSLATYTLVMEAFKTRSGYRHGPSRLTGEWILFEKYKGTHFFLTLATHEEARTTPDLLRERLDRAREHMLLIGAFENEGQA